MFQKLDDADGNLDFMRRMRLYHYVNTIVLCWFVGDDLLPGSCGGVGTVCNKSNECRRRGSGETRP